MNIGVVRECNNDWLLLLLFLFLFERPLQESLRLHRFKSDRGEI